MLNGFRLPALLVVVILHPFLPLFLSPRHWQNPSHEYNPKNKLILHQPFPDNHRLHKDEIPSLLFLIGRIPFLLLHLQGLVFHQH